MSSVTNSRFISCDDHQTHIKGIRSRRYLEEELLRANLESLYARSFKVLLYEPSVLCIALHRATDLLLANISHERVDLISLLDKPCKNTRCIWKW